MLDYIDVIKGPIVTEKNNDLIASNNTYVFSVDIRANKVQIKQAIEKMFDVKVEKINISNVKPKRKRVGRYYGKRNKVKKAMVKLKEGDTIKIY